MGKKKKQRSTPRIATAGSFEGTRSISEKRGGKGGGRGGFTPGRGKKRKKKSGLPPKMNIKVHDKKKYTRPNSKGGGGRKKRSPAILIKGEGGDEKFSPHLS